jgi:outer membrane protein
MRSVSLVFNIILAAAVAVLFYLHFSSSAKTKPAVKTATTEKTGEAATPNRGGIAYVDIDTLQENYSYFKAKKTELENKQKAMENEFGNLARKFEQDVMALQQKAQSGGMTQSEMETAQKTMAQRQQNLEKKRSDMGEQLLKTNEDFNKNLQKQLDDYLAEYNKDKGYDYILSYAKGGSILVANPDLNITKDVLEGMESKIKAQPAK